MIVDDDAPPRAPASVDPFAHPDEILAGPDEEVEAVGRWVGDRIAEGVEPHEIGIFVRSSAQLRRVRNAAKQSGAPAVELSDKVETTPGRLSIGTMHLAKGLEFRAGCPQPESGAPVGAIFLSR